MEPTPVPAKPASAWLPLLVQVGQAFHSISDPQTLLTTILEQLQAAIGSESSAIWLLNPDHTELRCTLASGIDAPALAGKTLPPEKLLDYYQRQAAPVIKIDTGDNPAAFPLAECLPPGPHNLLLAFLVARSEFLGHLCLINKLGRPNFTETDIDLLSVLASQAALAIQNAQLAERQRRQIERKQLLDHISRHLQQTLDIDVLIQRIFAEVNQAIHAEAQSVWLLNAAAGSLECRFATGPSSAEVRTVTVPVGQGIVGASVARQEPILIADAQKDPRFFRGADAKTGLFTRSLLCVPMVLEGKSIGAIEAINKQNNELFAPDDLDLLRSIADSAALAIQNAKLYSDLDASYNNTLDALAAALDLRDRETEGHSRRVVEFTTRLGRQMQLPEVTLAVVRRGALIHDIGKIGVPDAILRKPGPLTPEERKVIEQHPQAGYEMLLDIPYLQEEIKIVLAHQEHWDGTGYPYGLKGAAIPLGARLFAIADTLDALMSDRPYRKGQPYETARRIIAAEAGRQFDPQAVEAFLSIPPEEWTQIRANVMRAVTDRLTAHAEHIRLSHESATPTEA